MFRVAAGADILRAQMRSRKTPQATRYPYADVLAEVQRVVAAQPRGTSKALAAVCNLHSAGFSERLRGGGKAFSIEQLGAIADALGAPAGWPFVEWGGTTPTTAVVLVGGPRRREGQQLRRIAQLLEDVAKDLEK